ncbi:MAG: UDP-N-acetylmuramoyl-L-alanine--D-glutamate ligase [Tannerella sp.]|jgi:UDP-N-acetylmuramoylalanine--D-glutamate ligase|nr:UDP-N-acetylmuramoyl-L-alanine--D-glutamate ligase [Tannerella sp.]
MKRMVILGAGESGTGAAVLAQKQGFDVFVSDLSSIRPEHKLLLEKYNIPFEENQHTGDKILNADEIIKSPGIPDKAPVIQQIIAHQIHIISEIEFAGRYTGAKMICITGSNGKTTTTMLTYHILQQAGLDVGLAGNVGNSLAFQVAETPHEYYVVELSSFQLDNMYDFKADIAILLNITPDHLDRYHYEFQNYIDAKFRILQNQTEADAFIFWNDDPVIARELAKRCPKAALYPFSDVKNPGVKSFAEKGEIRIETLNGSFSMPQAGLALKGIHNLYNSLSAATAAKILGVSNETIRQSLSDFAGVEHRMEHVARIADVDYINDSKATNVDSCRYALQSIETPIVLILGGTDKGNDYTDIEDLVTGKVHTLIFLGVDNEKLHTFFDHKISRIVDARSMDEAVSSAHLFANQGDTVLLSPCCASFDLFQNYEDRGHQFKNCVHGLSND